MELLAEEARDSLPIRWRGALRLAHPVQLTQRLGRVKQTVGLAARRGGHHAHWRRRQAHRRRHEVYVGGDRGGQRVATRAQRSQSSLLVDVLVVLAPERRLRLGDRYLGRHHVAVWRRRTQHVRLGKVGREVRIHGRDALLGGCDHVVDRTLREVLAVRRQTWIAHRSERLLQSVDARRRLSHRHEQLDSRVWRRSAPAHPAVRTQKARQQAKSTRKSRGPGIFFRPFDRTQLVTQARRGRRPARMRRAQQRRAPTRAEPPTIERACCAAVRDRGRGCSVTPSELSLVARSVLSVCCDI